MSSAQKDQQIETDSVLDVQTSKFTEQTQMNREKFQPNPKCQLILRCRVGDNFLISYQKDHLPTFFIRLCFLIMFDIVVGGTLQMIGEFSYVVQTVCIAILGVQLFLYIALQMLDAGTVVVDEPEIYDQQRFRCTVCRVLRNQSTRHCQFCNVCTHKIDHHCSVFNKCIARRNLTCFWGFLLTSVVTMLLAISTLLTALIRN